MCQASPVYQHFKGTRIMEEIQNRKDWQNDIRLSFHQMEIMKHALGYNLSSRIYNAYRNRYVCSTENPHWEELVRMGLATKREFEIERQIVYYVSDYGKKYLGCLLGCVIKEVE